MTTTPETSTAAALNRLIEANTDDANGLRASAEQARGAPLRALLLRNAAACERSAAELQVLVDAAGGKAADSGSTTAALQRGWQQVVAGVTGTTDAALLADAEAAAEKTTAAYDAALQTPLTATARSTVERQHRDTVQALAQLQALVQHDKA